jgi:predicted ribosome quality control (RQC) complex YloA/Tae2 family protein
MEGLLLAQALRPLTERLHQGDVPRLAWRFPDPRTFVLPIVPHGALWIDLRLPLPRLALRDDALPGGQVPSAFQAMLAARATGPLVAVRQAALDRRVTLAFGAGTGFVPTEPARLEIELTGRNANVVLTTPDGLILGAWREVGADVNRFRQVRPGIAYEPPPPYEKLDPRSATTEELRTVLAGRPLARAHRAIDGVGPRLTAAWSKIAGVDPQEPLEGASLEAALTALARLVDDPAAVAGDDVDLAVMRRGERRATWAGRVRRALEAQAALVARRLQDADEAEARAAESADLRNAADLLLAHARSVPRGADGVELIGFDGHPVRLSLDPRLGAVAQAERWYDQARRREARAARSAARRPDLESEAAAVAARLGRIDDLDDAALAAWAEELDPPPVRAADRRPGVRVVGPHGFEVVVGRNARENDEVTFRVARSLDVWLHAQGVHGAHVVIRSGGREVPADTLRFAAELAAGHAQVAGEGTALVDHTLRKHVWKVKGMPAGAVHYAHQRTLAVAPRRLSQVEGEEAAHGA